MIKNFNRQHNRHVPLLNNYREIEDAATSSSRDSNPRPSDPSWLVVALAIESPGLVVPACPAPWCSGQVVGSLRDLVAVAIHVTWLAPSQHLS